MKRLIIILVCLASLGSQAQSKKTLQKMPVFNLSLFNGKLYDETMIAFKKKTTPELDLKIDSPKLITNINNVPSVWSLTHLAGLEQNYLNFPLEQTSIPIVYKSNVNTNLTFKASNCRNLNNYQFYLIDNELNRRVNILDTSCYEKY